ncbi:flagellar basal body rod protein FlgB [Teredinibacter turnerae]|uniref:Flagellar basal body rod protein FlgB n=1 Tax=Teredinibacter turnerae (strain ATCC 39867 / T7901) TaxID=377629 RepID=C5BRR7_TERTT|nr:flagellar basal body rod protein FlgB [Teredinibacter turnerae]ACR14282.1 flagellar basal-body rod protein FlgB [Teredinibacter turnerae T7901]
MAITFEKALGIHESAMRLRGERAGMLASNLANTDTPGYKARDFNFQEALDRQMTGRNGDFSLQTTQHAHIRGGVKGLGSVDALYRVPNQPSIDGNTVEEQVEHAEFMKNNLEFQASFTFLNSKFKGLSKAIKGE